MNIENTYTVTGINLSLRNKDCLNYNVYDVPTMVVHDCDLSDEPRERKSDGVSVVIDPTFDTKCRRTAVLAVQNVQTCIS